ncbi:MAG: hypothetical protein WCL02_08340 [bacterium]
MSEIEQTGELEIKKQLSERLKSKEYYENLLLDMMRANEIDKAEYDLIFSQCESSYSQFKKDVLAHKEE